MRPARGFTLIEILVVLGIVGLLIGLLLVAIQPARQASREAQCANNLRQIGLAMASYQGVHGVYPSAMPYWGRTPNCFAPFVRILPELEQAALFHAINFEVDQTPMSICPENATAAGIVVDVFLCPSDRAPAADELGPLNYRVNLGSGIESYQTPAEAGAFGFDDWLGPSSFRDGLSTTALVSERLRGDGQPSRFDTDRDHWFAGLGPTVPPTADALLARCAAIPAGVPSHDSRGGSTWLIFGYDRCFYNHVGAPNARVPDCAAADDHYGNRGGEDAGHFAARSVHARGVNLLTADGSVHAVRSAADLAAWRALGTRSGGEVVAPPF